ncbi:PASTA domain-containing protein [Microbispora sp. H11081]|uniref:PASTA domain-containing protein n=1 Tax=Microbispora sp. H11081 TaxID=2729107 RepID=UPI001472EB80|nr:PASTA domain-containing protein [Microbispora sp. H11081]
MNVEEALRDAMAAQVAGVQAPPSLGQAVRRRNRRHVVRFRVAGAALLTAAVAVTVPVVLTGGPGTAPAVGDGQGNGAAAGQGAPVASATGSGDTVAVPANLVPDMVGKSAEEGGAALKEAGYTVRITKVVSDKDPAGTVVDQTPAPGTSAPPGAAVTLIVAATAAPAPDTTEGTESPGMPQDLGDLGDGRTLGGVRVGYLPDGLEWGKWSGKDGFGTRSYTTSWVEPGLEPGMYSVQIVIYRKDAAKKFGERLKGFAAQGAKAVEAGDRKAYLVSLSEGGDELNDGGTRTIAWNLAPGVGVEVMMSPDYAAKIGAAAADRELKKIAAEVAVVK